MRIRAIFTCLPFLDLEVDGAVQFGGGGPYVANYTGVANDEVTVRAEMVLGDAVAWVVQPAGVVFNNPANDRITIPLDNPANVLQAGQTITVTATTNTHIQRTLSIFVRPQLQALGVVADHYAFPAGGGAWYAYDLTGLGVPGNPAVNLQIQTLPNTATAWEHIGWNARVPPMGPIVNLNVIDGRTQSLLLNAAQQVRVSTGVAGTPHVQQRNIDIRAPRDWAVLANNLQVELNRFIYAGGFDVIRENAMNFNARYSPRWVRNQAPRPQAFAAGAVVTLQHVTLNVTNPPNALTAVTVRATAYLTHANGAFSALQGQVAANIPNAHVGNIDIGNIVLGALPNEVMRNNPLLIFWEINTGGAWTLFDISQNTLYVTAQAPVPSTKASLNVGNNIVNPIYAYHSLLDMSCRAANGLAGGAPNINAVRDAIYGLFNPANPNANVQRLNPGGAPVQLRYWDNYLAGAPIGQSLNGPTNILAGNYNLFTAPNGNIACGVWADLLIAMWAIHGLGSGRFIEVEARGPGLFGGLAATAGVTAGNLFLVRNWSYNNPGNLNPGAYTHVKMVGTGNVANGPVNRARPMGNGVAGQNNANPPPEFFNHFIVREGAAGNFYDPSYGTAPLARNAWVDASLAGLWDPNVVALLAPHIGFVQANGAMPNGIQMNPLAVALYDYAAPAGWIP